jgi:hypothetical protein
MFFAKNSSFLKGLSHVILWECVEKPAETQASIRLASHWSEHLAPNLEAVSSKPLRGHEPGAGTIIAAIYINFCLFSLSTSLFHRSK